MKDKFLQILRWCELMTSIFHFFSPMNPSSVPQAIGTPLKWLIPRTLSSLNYLIELTNTFKIQHSLRQVHNWIKLNYDISTIHQILKLTNLFTMRYSFTQVHNWLELIFQRHHRYFNYSLDQSDSIDQFHNNSIGEQ